jgi:hypothetical protein
MCFSFEISIGTFIVSWLSALYLLTKNLKEWQRQDVIFLMIFSTMQLADAILWWDGMRKNNLNYYISSLAIPAILSAQVLYNVLIRNKNEHTWLTALGIVACIYMFLKFRGYSKSVCEGKFSSPIWASSELHYWEMVIFLILIIYPNWAGIGFTALVVFPLLYYLARGGYGSLWCAMANGLAIKYLAQY